MESRPDPIGADLNRRHMLLLQRFELGAQGSNGTVLVSLLSRLKSSFEAEKPWLIARLEVSQRNISGARAIAPGWVVSGGAAPRQVLGSGLVNTMG